MSDIEDITPDPEEEQNILNEFKAALEEEKDVAFDSEFDSLRDDVKNSFFHMTMGLHKRHNFPVDVIANLVQSAISDFTAYQDARMYDDAKSKCPGCGGPLGDCEDDDDDDDDDDDLDDKNCP